MCVRDLEFKQCLCLQSPFNSQWSELRISFYSQKPEPQEKLAQDHSIRAAKGRETGFSDSISHFLFFLQILPLRTKNRRVHQVCWESLWKDGLVLRALFAVTSEQRMAQGDGEDVIFLTKGSANCQRGQLGSWQGQLAAEDEGGALELGLSLPLSLSRKNVGLR